MSIEYFSGFFDADGAVAFGFYGKPHKAKTTCSVYNNDRLVLEEFQKQFGGYIYVSHSHPERGWNTNYRWMINGMGAENLLIQIAPFLLVKKERAQLALRFKELLRQRIKSAVVVRGKGGRIIQKDTTAFDNTELNFLAERVRILNRRGCTIDQTAP